MAAAVSVSRAAGEEECCPRPLYERYDQAKLENWAAENRRDSEASSHDDDSSAGSEYRRRAEEELTALSPEEIANRLERTRREFYNRRKIIIKNLPADVTNQASNLHFRATFDITLFSPLLPNHSELGTEAS